MPIITAEEARALVSKTQAYKDQILSKFEAEIRANAERGLTWVHLSFDLTTTREFIDDITEELVSAGYRIQGLPGTTITASW